MTRARDTSPEQFFAGHPAGLAAFRQVCEMLAEHGLFEVRISKSQTAFWREHGFAYLWMPGEYLKRPTGEVVLSIVLGRRDDSTRFKEVAHPSPGHWMHHLEIHHLADLDEQVAAWLAEAADHAGGR